ncbi:hypothetical protein HRbin23_00634 [bacterium HR23]|nr:hypothetical protein HRbin23_00634 [bacterium HR23]
MPLRLAGEMLTVNGVDGLGWLREVRAWDASPALVVDQQGTGRLLELRKAGSAVWLVDSSGHFLAALDGWWDIGQPGANRPRHIYTWGDVWAGSWLRAGYGAYLGGVSPSWWKFDPQATRFLIRDDTSALDKVAITRGVLPADGATALSLERRAGGASALVAVQWKDASALSAGDKVLLLAG